MVELPGSLRSRRNWIWMSDVCFEIVMECYVLFQDVIFTHVYMSIREICFNP